MQLRAVVVPREKSYLVSTNRSRVRGERERERERERGCVLLVMRGKIRPRHTGLMEREREEISLPSISSLQLVAKHATLTSHYYWAENSTKTWSSHQNIIRAYKTQFLLFEYWVLLRLLLVDKYNASRPEYLKGIFRILLRKSGSLELL